MTVRLPPALALAVALPMVLGGWFGWTPLASAADAHLQERP